MHKPQSNGTINDRKIDVFSRNDDNSGRGQADHGARGPGWGQAEQVI